MQENYRNIYVIYIHCLIEEFNVSLSDKISEHFYDVLNDIVWNGEIAHFIALFSLLFLSLYNISCSATNIMYMWVYFYVSHADDLANFSSLLQISI